jgi:hypothetical protein
MAMAGEGDVTLLPLADRCSPKTNASEGLEAPLVGDDAGKLDCIVAAVVDPWKG